MRVLLRGALVVAVLLGPGRAAAQGTDPDDVATTEEEEEELLPYRGTSIVYENAFTALSMDPSAEPDYNPSYVMSWSFNPRYYLYDRLSARLGFSVEQEITNSDSTQDIYEPVVSDVTLGFVYSPFYTIPVADIRIGGGVTFGFPTSKISQARTLYFSLAPSLSLARSFDVLGGLELSYGFRYTKNFNKYTGAVAEDTVFPCPSNLEDRTECFNMGSRNPSMSFSNTFSAQIYWFDKFYTTVQVGVINALLYPVAPAEVETLGGTVTVEESPDNTDHRGSMSYAIEIGYDAFDYLSFALGVSTVNGQLRDDGEYWAPFFNRYSSIYFDVALSVDGLVQTIMGQDDEDDAVASVEDRQLRAVAAR